MRSFQTRFMYALLCTSLMLALTGVQPAFAAGIVVNSNTDAVANDGVCTLREAILNANEDNQSWSTDCASGLGDDTITFAANYTITLAGTQLPMVTSTITITGNGAANTIIQANAYPELAANRVFEVGGAGILTIDGLTVKNGVCNSNCNDDPSAGGGIYNAGKLVVQNSAFTANKSNSGSAIYSYGSLSISNGTFLSNNGDVVYNTGGSLSVTNSSFSSNIGAGIYNSSSSNSSTVTGSTFTANSVGINNTYGVMSMINSTFSYNSEGGIFNYSYGSLTIINSTFYANSASYGGGIINYGVITVKNSTFVSNSASNNGGGIYSYSGNVIVANNTFSNNSAQGTGGGIYTIGGTLTVTNSTFSNNSSDTSSTGGVGGIDNTSSNNLIMKNTIIANSLGADCKGGVAISGNNLIESTGVDACDLTNGSNGNIIGQDPKLGPLANNGGSTQTFALLSGSPAIDAGNDTACATPPIYNLDQRGETRPKGTHCDIGAYEASVQAVTYPSVSSIVTASTNPTSAASVTYTVTFSAAVTSVDAADFSLNTSGVTGASITGVTGSGPTYTVTVNTGTGNGTIRLDLTDNDTILDGQSNPLGGTGSGNGSYSSGQTYTVNKTVTYPSVSSIVTASANPTSAASATYTVTFSAAVTGVDPADFSLNASGVTGASITGVTGTGSTYTITVNTGTGNGTIRLDLTDNDTIVDAQSNPLGGTGSGNGSYSSGQTYTVNKTVTYPSVSSIVTASANPTSAASVDFTATFSAAVTGVDADDFSLNTSGVTGASITGVSGSGATYTVTVNTGTGNGTIRLDLTDNDTIVDAQSTPLGGTGTGNGSYTSGQTYTVNKSASSALIDLDAFSPNPVLEGHELTFDLVFAVTNINPGVGGVELYLNYDPTLVSPATPAAVVLPDFFGMADVNINEVLPASKCPAGTYPCIHLALAGPEQATKTGVAVRFHFTAVKAGSACFIVGQSQMVNTNGFPVEHQTSGLECVTVQAGTLTSGVVQRQGVPASPNTGGGTPVCSSVTVNGSTIPPVYSDGEGKFQFLNIPAGTYTFHVIYPGYLATEKAGVSVTSTSIDLGSASLRGGDVNADNAINILDVGTIISKFGQANVPVKSASANCAATDEPTDINDDGLVNISDLAITAGNWGKVGPTAWP